MGVHLLLGPPDGMDTVVPGSAPITSVGRSPKQTIVQPIFSQENLEQHLDDFVIDIIGDVDLLVLDVGTSTLRPNRWAKTIDDLHDDELIEGRSSRHKSKQ